VAESLDAGNPLNLFKPSERRQAEASQQNTEQVHQDVPLEMESNKRLGRHEVMEPCYHMATEMTEAQAAKSQALQDKVPTCLYHLFIVRKAPESRGSQ